MAKKDTDVERLERENRELKRLNRQLMKQLKKVNKGYRKIREEDPVEEDENFEEEVQKEKCPKCYEPSLEEKTFTIFGGKTKTIKVCQECGHRESGKT